jgi:hypothetical protein
MTADARSHNRLYDGTMIITLQNIKSSPIALHTERINGAERVKFSNYAFNYLHCIAVTMHGTSEVLCLAINCARLSQPAGRIGKSTQLMHILVGIKSDNDNGSRSAIDTNSIYPMYSRIWYVRIYHRKV